MKDCVPLKIDMVFYFGQCGDEIMKQKGGGSFYIHMNLVPYDKAVCFLKMINSENEIPKYDFY